MNRKGCCIPAPSSNVRRKKLFLRVADAEWSARIPLETVGSAGQLVCACTNRRAYEFRVSVQLSSSCLTKIVTFMPYFLLLNNTAYPLQYQELANQSKSRSTSLSTDLLTSGGSSGTSLAGWTAVLSGQVGAFWPEQATNQLMLLRCRLGKGEREGEIEESTPIQWSACTGYFPFYESHSVYMRIADRFGGVFVDIQTSDELTLITVSGHEESKILAKLVNQSTKYYIHFRQEGEPTIHQLKPGCCQRYTWDDCRKPRRLICWASTNESSAGVPSPTSSLISTLSMDEFGVLDASPDKQASLRVYYVSFLNDMQRTVLFSEDLDLVDFARMHDSVEPITQDYEVSLMYIGLSLVDNERDGCELCYMSVTSSGALWSVVAKRDRLEALTGEQSGLLERLYSQHVNTLACRRPDAEENSGTEPANFRMSVALPSNPSTVLEVDFHQKMLLSPKRGRLERFLEPAVWLSASFTRTFSKIHFKLYKLQVDSQLPDAVFPVVFAPLPPAKSVVQQVVPRHLCEALFLYGSTNVPGVYRVKCAKALIQAMQIELDQAFISSMVDFFHPQVARVTEKEAFDEEVKHITAPLEEWPLIQAAIQGSNRMSLFDDVHVSSIKLHLSYSNTGNDHAQGVTKEFFNLLVKSVGVAFTDVQDVVLKLGYFERRALIISIGQLQSLLTRHYTNQALRQLYVLVFGLDVLGNPFGVLRGVAQGVEDLFVEPAKGAILGPGEFVQGMSIGVKSLVGHTVGGAAGAVSKITGTIGKGVAALTLDEEYQRRRRERMARAPQNLGGRIAQGGESVVLGFYHGMTGVLVQPISGAKKEGVEGFFKGIGKGLIGAVARPVSGLVDFASNGFDTIRLATDINVDAERVRLPRLVMKNAALSPYNPTQAMGLHILTLCDKGSIVGTCTYICHEETRSRRSVLMLTTTLLILAESNNIMANWSSSWKLPVSEVNGAPQVKEDGLLIVTNEPSKKSSIFRMGFPGAARNDDLSQNFVSKLVDLDRAAAKRMSRAVQQLREWI